MVNSACRALPADDHAWSLYQRLIMRPDHAARSDHRDVAGHRSIFRGKGFPIADLNYLTEFDLQPRRR